MTRRLTVLVLTPLLLAACSSGPHKQVAQQEDVAGIGPRPSVFGRHAWDEQQAAARAKAAASATPTVPAQPALPPVIAQAAPPPPAPAPAPLVAAAPPPPPVVMAPPAPAPPPPPQIAAMPAPVPTPVQPVLPSQPQPAPVMQTAQAEPVPATKPAKPEKPAKAPKPAKEAKPFRLPFGLKPVEAPPPPPPLVGGYGEPGDKKAVEAAAAFAVHESPGYELKGIYSAKTQVVAGTNYSLCLWVRQIRHEANPLSRRLVAATVFQGLDRHYELTHWHEVPECHAGT